MIKDMDDSKSVIALQQMIFVGEKHHKWPGLKSVAVVRSSRTNLLKGTTEQQTRYYISSLSGDAEKIARAAREHWGDPK